MKFPHLFRPKLSDTYDQSSAVSELTFLDTSYVSSLAGSRGVACSDFAIPVYLDTEALYGIWGTITGGFYVAEQRTIKSSTTETEGSSIGGGGGMNLSMVKLGVKASKSAGKTVEGIVQSSLDLFQTNEALFNNLRLVLGDKIIKNIKEYTLEEIAPADIVELRGSFSQMGGAGYSELLGSEQSPIKLSPTMLNREREIGYFGITLTEKPKGGAQEEKYYVGVNLFLKYTRGGTFTEIHDNELNLLGKIASKKKAPVKREREGNLLKIVPIAVFA